MGKLLEEWDRLDKYPNYIYTYYSDRYAGLTDPLCSLCKRDVEDNQHLFSNECPRVHGWQAALSINISNLICKAILISKSKPNVFFKAQGLLYDPLKFKIPHWKNVVNEDSEPQFFSTITNKQRYNIELLQYMNWFADTEKQFVSGVVHKLSIYSFWECIGVLPARTDSLWKSWGINEKCKKQLVLSIQQELAANSDKI